MSPPLRPDAPHRFHNGDLCLYHPKDHFWTPDQYVSATIIPWTALWLGFYELWLDTGKWMGPEAPHDQHKRTR